MSKVLGYLDVMVHILRAAAVLEDPMHEHQPHDGNLVTIPIFYLKHVLYE
jgi:hypothetical protein